MATAEQLKSLIRSHLNDDEERFFSVALQVAAHEALQGHGALAHDIRGIVDKAKSNGSIRPIVKFPQDLSGLVFSQQPTTPLSALVLPDALKDRISRIIHEHRQQDKLKSHGLSNRRKVLLVGPPGTGKTMTASVLAKELNLPLHTIQVDKLVTKFMGETSAKLRQIFELIQNDVGVYLFDEIDAIASERSMENDVGEMRRVLNALLQFIEQDTSDSIIIGATNTPKLLDRAIFRRFDDVLYFQTPDETSRQHLIGNIMGTFLGKSFAWKSVLSASDQLSHAEIDSACRDAIKLAILNDQKTVSTKVLVTTLRERSDTHPR
jgi:SpoVK/Ycf46/Vps4 family AAA+-type ATPase